MSHNIRVRMARGKEPRMGTTVHAFGDNPWVTKCGCVISDADSTVDHITCKTCLAVMGKEEKCLKEES